MNVLTVSQAADALHIVPNRVRQLIYEGVLPAQRLGSFWIVTVEAVELVKRRCKTPGRRPGAPYRGVEPCKP